MQFDALYEFVDRAVKNRKYPEGTGGGLKAALKLFQRELHEDEAASLEVFERNLDQIYRTVCAKNSSAFSAGSLATYKSRALKVLEDYKKYGEDPTKLSGWTPQWRATAKVKGSSGRVASPVRDVVPPPGVSSPPIIVASTNVRHIEVTLRPDARFLLEMPFDVTSSELSLIRSVIGPLLMSGEAYAQPSLPETSSD